MGMRGIMIEALCPEKQREGFMGNGMFRESREREIRAQFNWKRLFHAALKEKLGLGLE